MWTLFLIGLGIGNLLIGQWGFAASAFISAYCVSRINRNNEED